MLERNIVLIGMTGCGKTTVGKMLAEMTGYDFIDTDEVIESRYGKINELFLKGEDYFRDIETETIKTFSDTEKTVIALGAGAVLRKTNINILRENGIMCLLDRSLENIKKTIDRSRRPLLSGGDGKLEQLYSQRINLYEKYADVKADNNSSLKNAAENIINAVKEL